MLKYIFFILISLILVFIQISFFGALPILANLNILLVFLIFINIVFGFDTGFIFALLIGFFLNLYSFLPWGTFIVIFLAIIWLLDFLYKNVFINFSIYSNLIMVIIGTILYVFSILLAYFIFYLMGLIKIYIVIDKLFWQSFSYQIILNLVLMSGLFYLAKLTIKRLNIVFLFKK
ncbi:MAG: hypothetical protein NTX00_02225 [Candidatus Parcubacteria bacterium]|nr:hypothetical protein [Candidatus Parcubacteria bacterium]